LDFLSATDAGRLVPAEEDAGSEVSEWERRDRREAEERVPRGNWVPGRKYRRSYPRPPWHPQKTRISGRIALSFVTSFALASPFGDDSICDLSLVRILSSWGRPGRRAKGSLQRAACARTADGKNGQKGIYAAIV